MPDKRIVVVEGVDGTGKTTIARELAMQLGYTYVKTPDERYAALKRYYDCPGVSAEARLTFYCFAVRETVMSALEDTSAPGLVLDRYRLSCKYYHLLAGADPELIDGLITTLRFPDPHYCLVLTAPEETIAARLIGRPEVLSCWEDLSFLPRVNQAMITEPGIEIMMNDGTLSPVRIARMITEQQFGSVS
jgi:thymidylate kinase